MCGIAGVATWRPMINGEAEVIKMTTAIAHRGPDDSGQWVDAEVGIAFGHRRLSIIDLSPQGHQPMGSATGRYMIVYNGEIYNYQQIRKQLEGIYAAPDWRGHSDTEVLLAAVEAWGIEGALQRCIGMFAIALWDRQERTLTFARDRMGEKPLYYTNAGGKVLFGSELKALRALGDDRNEIDRHGLTRFMEYGYIPGTDTIFSGVKKLTAGHYVTLASPSDVDLVPTAYWRPICENVIEQRALLASASDAELIDLVHDQLRESVKLQMVSDVPIGAFLSGGVDSSLVTSLMQSQGKESVRTFTIGFEEREFNEAIYAKDVAKHLGTVHTELYVNAQDALNIIPKIPDIYDEPFADSSQIPTILVSRMTRQHVKVALSGDGGDELFAGYPRYWLAANLWKRMSSLPLFARRAAARSLKQLSPSQWDNLLARVVSKNRFQDFNGRRMHRLAQLLVTGSQDALYTRLTSQWAPEDGLVLNPSARSLHDEVWPTGGRTPIESIRLRDMKQYLCDDLLVKVDRASMSTSLETRAPLLSHKIVELALCLPENALVRDGTGKWILRQVLDRYVPRQLIERPKAGFAVPLGIWLRGPLRDWADDLLNTSKITSQGYLDARLVEGMWNEHRSGKYDRSPYLWNILMFQAWLNNSRNVD